MTKTFFVFEHVMRLPASCAPILLFSMTLTAQSASGDNLIPNPGFEEHAGVPDEWFYTGADFTEVMKYWESPTGSSPDVYGPKIYIPRHWRDKGFGQGRSHGGQAMVGITVYGCHGGKPHCREYLQTQLIEPLVPGQRYEVSFWVRHLPNSLQINNIGVAFNPYRIIKQTDEMITVDNPFSSPDVLTCAPGQWLRQQYEFVSETDAGYLIIGNFKTDEATRVRNRCPGDCLPFAYYYVDDVALKKLPPILPIPVAPDDLSKATLEEGVTIQLNYIYFDSGKADFLPRSFRELNTLLGILIDHPTMRIEVRGHTDNLGSDEYNMQLSLSRAQNVIRYLTDHGIASERLTYKGFGNSQPLKDNSTDVGRSHNRRVEFFIIQM